MTDPIADMLTRIRNAQLVKKTEVFLPYSKIKHNIAKILENEKWLGQVEVVEPQLKETTGKNINNVVVSKFKQLRIEIKYEKGQPKISSIQRVSKPGRRIYASKDEMPVVLNNYGVAIISTSKGLMTNKQAKKTGVGGEIICEVY